MLAGGASAATSNVGPVFKTPSGNILCFTANSEFERSTFWCRALANARGCVDGLDVGWVLGPGQRGSRNPNRGPVARCGEPGTRAWVAGQAASSSVQVLRYGQRLSIEGAHVVCVSRKTALECRNRGDHGFVVSKERLRLS